MTSISSLGIGSGLDLSGLLDQLKQGEQKQLTPILNQKASYQSKLSAFGTLKNALSKLQDAAGKLADPSAFKVVSSKVSGSALTASAGDTTPPGSYQIDVAQRAKASSVATLGVADDSTDLGAGTLTFTLGNGDSVDVQVDADHSSLGDIRDAINAKDAGINAAIVNDGSGTPYRLVLSARDTGTDAAITNVDFGSGDLAGALSLDANTRIDAQNAQLTVNGIQIESQSNRVQGAIQGVTLNLTEDSGSVTLAVTRDNDAIKKAVTDFADAYNSLHKTLGNLTHYDASTGDSGVLLGNGTARTVESRLRGVLGDAYGGGDLSTLSSVGVRLQLDGTLKVDDDTLSKVTAGDIRGLSDFFSGGATGTGLADTLDNAIGDMTGDGGLIAGATDGLNNTLDSLDDQYQETQNRIDDTMARYRDQFSKLDSLISKMNSTSSYLTQQFDAMSGQTGSGS